MGETEATLIRGGRVTRRQVIQAASKMEGPFSHRDLAKALGARDYQVRGAMAWCIKARLFVPQGCEVRTDRSGRAYRAVKYRWTGSTAVRRNEPARLPEAAERWLLGA